MAEYPNPGNQGVMINTLTFPEMYDLVNKKFVTLDAMIKPAARQLYIEDTPMENEGNSKRYDEYDVQTYSRVKREGQGTSSSSVAIGYTKTMTPRRLGTKITVTWEDRRFNRYKKVAGDMVSLAHFNPNRMELDLTHRLSFGTSTSYTNMDGDTVDLTCGDGLELFKTTHTLKHSSTTYSNRLSGDPVFSKGSLEAAQTLVTTDIYSNFGETRTMDFNVIVTSNNPTVVNSVRQLLESMSDNTQNNSGVKNTHQGELRHVVLPMLDTTAAGIKDSTKKNWWGIVATGAGSVGGRWQAYHTVWEQSHLVSPDEGNTKDGDKDTWEFHTRAMDGSVVLSGRGIIFSCPTS